MSVKLLACVAAVGEGHKMNVSALCRDGGVSRKTFYKWVGRYRTGGLEALAELSRRPHRSPKPTAADVEDAIVRLRKELSDAGLDHGATTIQWHLGRSGDFRGRVPSVASVHRVLVRRGMVVPAPQKRPKSSWKRFEASAPNERWQIDAMDWAIATGVVRVFNIVDDHSRVAVRSRAVPEATTQEAWATFGQGAEAWGLPAGVLSDNGLAFSGKLRGFEVAFEANLRDAGVLPRTGRPYHPQTTGKVERFQQTLKKWLRRQPLAADLAALQAQLDEFCRVYNNERPHQGIGRRIPIDRWKAGTPAKPADRPLAHPEPAEHRLKNTVVEADGRVRAGRYHIHIGADWAGQPAVIQIHGLAANVFVNDRLVRHLTIDPARTYQPSGRKRGPTKRPRLHS
jgi:transposase InsO family protein